MHACMHAYIQTYKHTYIHTYIHFLLAEQTCTSDLKTCRLHGNPCTVQSKMYMLRIVFPWQNSHQTRTLKLASTSRQIRMNFASNSHFKFALQSRINIASNIVSNSPTDTPSLGLSRPLKPHKSAIGRPAEVLGLTGAETQRGKQHVWHAVARKHPKDSNSIARRQGRSISTVLPPKLLVSAQCAPAASAT